MTTHKEGDLSHAQSNEPITGSIEFASAKEYV